MVGDSPTSRRSWSNSRAASAQAPEANRPRSEGRFPRGFSDRVIRRLHFVADPRLPAEAAPARNQACMSERGVLPALHHDVVGPVPVRPVAVAVMADGQPCTLSVGHRDHLDTERAEQRPIRTPRVAELGLGRLAPMPIVGSAGESGRDRDERLGASSQEAIARPVPPRGARATSRGSATRAPSPPAVEGAP